MTVLQLFFGRKQSSNRELIEQIILSRYNQYYRLAYSYTHNEADASDIVQNGAYKALRGSQSLKEPEFAATWVYRIMLNECFDYVRHPDHLSYESMLEENGVELGNTEDTYEDIDLQRALDALPVQDKAIVILKYFEDKTLEEIAEILDENVNTVKSRLYRSLKKLRVDLTREEPKQDVQDRRKER
ncbi:MAG: RNA polymerase sigma factor [Acetatifactor sp.]